jgi:nicotinamidase-related amidase
MRIPPSPKRKYRELLFSSRSRATALVPLHALCLAMACGFFAAAANSSIVFNLQTRRHETGALVVAKESIDPAKIGVVVIDMWNTNDCMTNAQRAAAMVPRMNKALEAARHLGMQIIWSLTDVADQYVGMPQRERAIALPQLPLPHIANFACPFSVNTVRPEKCMCGPGIACHPHFGWDQMDPNLVIAPDDWIIANPNELYAVFWQQKLKRLIYMGVNTNLCVMNKPEGIAPMTAAGVRCILARDLTDAETSYDPDRGITPDTGTEKDIADVERAGIPTVNMVDEMKRAGYWNSQWVTEKVRLAPWGTRDWPYLFTNSVKVTLVPYEQHDVTTRYTLDASEPGPASTLYSKPLEFRKTTQIRVAAFRNGRRVSLVSDGYFVLLGHMPPKPDVYLDRLKAAVPYRPNWRWEPKSNQSFGGAPLSIRDATYGKGMGMRAPGNLLYEIKPGYDRFVARAGVDDEPFRQRSRAQFLATYPSVRFQVYIDGTLASESPIMRLSQEPWRFDVKIPSHSRLINLVLTDAGSRSPLDLADWVDAGFVLKH